MINSHPQSVKLRTRGKTRIFLNLLMLLYGSLTFVKIVQFSSFTSTFSQLSTKVDFLIKILVVAIVLLAILTWIVKSKTSLRQLIFSLFFASVVVLAGMKSGFGTNFDVLILLSFFLFLGDLKLSEIIFSQSVGMLSGLMGVTILSVLGYLPMSGSASQLLFFQSGYKEIVYFWGFNHPNVYGNILTMSVIGFFWSRGCRNIRFFTFLLAGVAVFDLVIGANTVLLGTLIVLVGIFTVQFSAKFDFVIRDISKLLTVILPLLSIWLGYNVNSNVAQAINRLVSSRPAIWNYYLNLDKLSMFAIPPVIDLSVGSKIAYGNGVLDGSYIYILIYWGIVPLVIYLLSFWVLVDLPFKNNNVRWITAFLTVAMLLMSFPESHMMSYFENGFLMVLGLLQFSKIDRASRIF